MEIKVLGTGCPSCKRLESNVYQALKDSETDAEVSKVTDIKDILSYGVMGTPALVIDGEVVSSGKVLSPKQIIALIKK